MRIIGIALVVVVVLGLASCSLGRIALGPAPTDQGEGPGQATVIDAGADATGTDAPTAAEEFCRLFEGTWITVDGYIAYIGLQTETGEPLFVWGIQDSDVFYGAGAITSIEALNENEYDLIVSFPESAEGGFTYEAFDADVHVRYNDEKTRTIDLTFGVEPERRHYFDDGEGVIDFVTVEDFWSYLLGTGMGELLIDPDTDNYVRFFDIGGDPRYEFGNLAIESDGSNIGVIEKMTLEDDALVLTIHFPDAIGDDDTIKPTTSVYKVCLFGQKGVSMFYPDGEWMGDFYFGVG